MSKHHFLLALAFATASLTAVHSVTFAWLTGLVYHDNIRGYVPAGFKGMFFLFIAWVLLQVRLALVGRRRRRMARYILGGFLGVPVALVIFSLYTDAALALLGYSLQKDIAISSVGVVLFTALSVTLHRCYMSAKSDNNSVEPTRALSGASDSP